MKTTARAFLINPKGLCLFVQHNEWKLADRGKWATVGGRIEEGESHEACLRRELIEEFGSSIGDNIEIGPKIFENFGKDRHDCFYVVWFKGDEITIEANEEILNHKWCSPNEAKQLDFFFGVEADLFVKALLVQR